MISTRRTLIISLGVVFLTGLAVGALGHRYYALSNVRAHERPPRDPDEWRKNYVRDMTERLKLSPAQLEKLEGILDATREKYRVLRERTQPEMDAIREGQIREIDEILSPGQRVEYAKRRQELEARRKRGGGPPR